MNKALCPYCGHEMKTEELLPFSGDCAYTCECGGLRRRMNTGKEDTYAVIRRPLQKPLTLEEACGSKETCMYFEDKGFGEISVASMDIYSTYGGIRYKNY